MKIDRLTVTAQVKLKIGSADEVRLSSMFVSGDKVVGLVDQFPWMPFVVISKISDDSSAVFDLRMLQREKG